MPKTKISEYSTTNSANTDIESINIDEGCAPSGINNAIRELMVHLKEFQTGSSGDPLTVAGTFVASGGATLSGTNTLSGSTVMTASAGTSASPSIHFSSDTNTGIFSPAADTIAFAEGGAEAMRIDSSGNVGIGTTSPGNRLAISQSVSTTFGNAGTYLGLGGTENASGQMVLIGFGYKGSAANEYPAVIGYTATNNGGNQNGALVFGTRDVTTNTAPTERMRIDSSGNVGIGTSSPGTVIDAQDATGATRITVTNTANAAAGAGVNFLVKNGGTTVGDATIRVDNSDNLAFFNIGGERARIDSSGYFYVNNMAVGGTANLHWSSGAGQFFVTSSSRRFKHDIVDYDKGLAEVLQMQPKYFVYNQEPNQKQRAGFIAEDFHDLGMTEYVEYWKDDEGNDTPSEIGYSNMVAILVKAIQEQQALITQLQADVAALKGTA